MDDTPPTPNDRSAQIPDRDRPSSTKETVVVVVGGGYGGVSVAKALDDIAAVVLVEPREAFAHNVAALRGLVDPHWTSRIFHPYDSLLTYGRVVRDRAIRVDPDAVTLSSGEQVAAGYIVLATGSAYPFPAKVDVDDVDTAITKFRNTRAALAEAGSVLLLGAGPVGLELAGEIKAVWPDKTVTIVDPATDVLGAAYSEELREELRRQLDALGVRLLLNTTLRNAPPSEPGIAATFSVTASTGDRIDADIWFRCYGATPVSDYLAPSLAGARRPSGRLTVADDLRLLGQERVFAIGDVTAIPESKRAKAAFDHAVIVAHNIQTLTDGNGDLATYQPQPPGIVLPLGPAQGASYSPDVGVLGAAETSAFKGANLQVDGVRDLLNLN